MGNNVKNRIEQALNMRNMKRIELAEKTGISKATISNWINQKYQPKQESLFKLAKVLNVNEMWLAGYNYPIERTEDVNIEDIIKSKAKANEFKQLVSQIREDEDLKNLFISICSLSEDQRKSIVSLVNELSKLNSLH